MSLESVSAAKLRKLSIRWHAESRLRPAVGGGSSRLPIQLLDQLGPFDFQPAEHAEPTCRSSHCGVLGRAAAHAFEPPLPVSILSVASTSTLGSCWSRRHSLADKASPGNQDTPSNSATRSRADASAPAVSALPLKRSIIVLAMRSSTVPSAYDTHHGLT